MKSMMIISYLFIFMIAVSALLLIFSRNIFKAALLLLCSLLGVAALYILSFAEFLAVAQIMIYAGGVVVIIIFGIMLTRKMSDQALEVGHHNIFSASLLSLTLLAFLVSTISGTQETFSQRKHIDNISGTGISLMTDYALAFEIAGILLLIALVGASVVASFNKIKSK